MKKIKVNITCNGLDDVYISIDETFDQLCNRINNVPEDMIRIGEVILRKSIIIGISYRGEE